MITLTLAMENGVSKNNMKSAQVSSKSDWVWLKVGGTLFMTTKSTLSKDSRSLLYRISQNDEDFGKVVKY